MVDLLLKPVGALSGTVKAPPSKAHTHRVFVAALLSEGSSEVKDPLISDDTLATLGACRMLGAHIGKIDQITFRIGGTSKLQTPEDVIDCRNSGSTMRFLAPVCALAEGISVLTGSESLRRRPMELLLDSLRQLGVECHSSRMNGYPPIIVFGGGIKGGKVQIRGDVSSQFISGLLFAVPKAAESCDISLSTPLESKPYIDITLDIIRKHGIKIETRSDYEKFHVSGGQRYRPLDHVVEGDYSSAAFLLAAAVITNSHVTITNLKKESLQGDRKIIEILEKMGAKMHIYESSVEICGSNNDLEPFEINLRHYPDLAPICSVLACYASGKSLIRGIERLRFKESNRVAAISSELSKFGAEIKTTKEGLEIQGGRMLHGAEVESHGDHRIAMSCAVAALRARGKTVVHEIECINKSYPEFVTDIQKLGVDTVER